MKYLRKDVREFYRVRTIVTFRSGRTMEQVYGPFTRKSKAREIRTRVSRSWDFVWREGRQKYPMRDPNTQVESIQYITEELPSLGWYQISSDTITAN